MQSQEAILKWWKNRKNYMMNIEITYIPIEKRKEMPAYVRDTQKYPHTKSIPLPLCCSRIICNRTRLHTLRQFFSKHPNLLLLIYLD